MGSFLPSMAHMMNQGMKTFRRFPLALFFSFVTTAIIIYFLAVEPDELKGLTLTLANIATTAMLGVFVFTTLRLLEHSMQKRTHMFVLVLGVLGLVGYYISLPAVMEDTGKWIYLFRHIFLIVLFSVAILWIPFVKFNESNEDYWAYVKGMILRYS